MATVKMSKQQKAYVAAKATYEALAATLDEKIAPLDMSLLENREFARNWKEQNGMNTAFQALKIAENNMIEWALDVVRKHPLYKQAGDSAEYVKQQADNGSYKARKMLVDLSFRLSAK